MKTKKSQILPRRFFGLALAAFGLFSLASHAGAGVEGKLRVFVPVAPYEYLFEKIAGDLVEVEAIVGEGDDAHSYTPTPKQIARMSEANLVCSGELGFEANYFIKLGDGKDSPQAVNLLEGLELLEGHCDHPSHQEEKEHKHEEGAEGEHEEHEHEHHDHDHEHLVDPHVWLSPKMLNTQAKHIAGILKSHLGDEADAKIDANLASFTAELNAIDAELQKTLAPKKGKKFYVYHGAFAYFAQDYGLEQVAVEIGNRRPTPKQLADISKQAKEDGVKLVFVQPQFDQSSAQSLAASIGGDVAELDPLEKDIIANLRRIAAAVVGK